MSCNTYVDESARNNYLLCGVNVQQNEISEVRDTLRALRPRSQSRIHMYQESKATQAALLREIRALNVSSWIISISVQVAKLPNSRFIAISKIAGIESFRESRLLVMDQSSSYVGDKRVLSQVARKVDYQFPHYRHMNSRHEPLLWLPDIIAWCYGRGGTWRDAVEPLVTEVIEL
jgi:hypothetical protein